MPEVKRMSHSFKQCLVKCQDLVVAQGQPSVLYINAKKKYIFVYVFVQSINPIRRGRGSKLGINLVLDLQNG